ncbi:MAG: hypothetical protein JST68_11455 [Bacteroidetes bacterium]|nr:hypothetical protein [Bacteroidota bacterium]
MKIIIGIGQILLLAFLGFVARETWRIYDEEKTAQNINKDGLRLRVQIDNVSNEKIIWRDYIGNSRYITFHYQRKEYRIRYIQDSIFLQDGILIPVVYSPSSDRFIQPGKPGHQTALYKTSPLIKWTSVRLFSSANAALFFAALLTAVVVLLATGMLANFTGLSLIRRLGDILVFLFAISGAIYLTYDAAAYWRYYSTLKRQGAATTAKIEDIDRMKEFNNDNSQIFIFYIYQARINFQGESRIIAVGSKDYEHLKPGDNIDVLYDESRDDMMSVNYRLLYHNLVFPLVVWVILIFFFNRRIWAWRHRKN